MLTNNYSMNGWSPDFTIVEFSSTAGLVNRLDNERHKLQQICTCILCLQISCKDRCLFIWIISISLLSWKAPHTFAGVIVCQPISEGTVIALAGSIDCAWRAICGTCWKDKLKVLVSLYTMLISYRSSQWYSILKIIPTSHSNFILVRQFPFLF